MAQVYGEVHHIIKELTIKFGTLRGFGRNLHGHGMLQSWMIEALANKENCTYMKEEMGTKSEVTSKEGVTVYSKLATEDITAYGALLHVTTRLRKWPFSRSVFFSSRLLFQSYI